MTRLHTCANCGDPAPNTWLCPVCEGLREEAKRECRERPHWGGPVAAVYAALTEYREKKQGLMDYVATAVRTRDTSAIVTNTE